MRPSAPCSLKRLRSVFRSLGKPANLAGGIVRPHRNSVAHGKPPQFAILNHAAVDSGIPRESATQRIGITPEAQVIFFRRRHQPRRPPPAKMSIGAIAELVQALP